MRLEEELEQRYQEGARTRRELQELSARLLSAQEEERRAISRELHDEVGQSLSALLMEAGNAAAHVPPAFGRGAPPRGFHQKLAEASVNVIRNMTLLLRPSMLDDFGLVPALEWQAREVSKRTGLRVQVSADDGAGELPDAHKTCIYRVVQEALHNCARHSPGALRQGGGGAGERRRSCFRVEDDGRGFDAAPRARPRAGGHGGTRHPSGWRFRVRSEPGAGTKVAVELPLAS